MSSTVEPGEGAGLLPGSTEPAAEQGASESDSIMRAEEDQLNAGLRSVAAAPPAWTRVGGLEGRPTTGDVVQITSSVNGLVRGNICDVLQFRTVNDAPSYRLAKIGQSTVEARSPIEWPSVSDI